MVAAHGWSKYNNDGCRCEVCAADNAEYHQSRRQARKAWVQANGLPKSVTHGGSAYVNWGCRCEVCLAGASENRQATRRRKRQNRLLKSPTP